MNIKPLKPTDDFLQQAQSLNIAFDDGDLDRLGMFLALLLETNRQFNLTRITDEKAVWQRHILDSLTLLPYLTRGNVNTACDVGSGAGVPGIPLAICLPDISFTLVEATGKKAAFIKNAAEELGLQNVVIINDRAEVLGQKREYRETFDVVFARALGRLNVAAELVVPLIRVGGITLLIKGAKADEELKEARKALGILGASHLETSPTPTGRIVILDKKRATPRLYPRRPGEPKRVPLK